jgi:hypothetical protein
MFRCMTSALALAISLSACSPGGSPSSPTSSSQQGSKAETYRSDRTAESDRQVKDIARAYGTSEGRVDDVAGRAAELSGGNASKQDMLDALKAASGR